MVAKGFVIRVPESLELITKPYLDEVWEYNKRDQLAWDFAITGGVTGDVFALITYEEPSPMQRRINPFSQGHVRVNLLGSEQVYPTWDPLNTDTLIAVRIETIYYAERGTRQLDREDRVNHEGRQLYTKRFTQIITRDQIVEQYHGDQPVIRPNVLGEIPMVHIRNMSLPKEYYGLPDGMDLIDVQRELNEKCTDVSDTINYHCVDVGTEILTSSGWKKYDELHAGDKALTLDPSTDEIQWQPVESVNVFDYDGPMVRWDNHIDALTTPNHRWLAEKAVGRPKNRRYEREFIRTSKAEGIDRAASEMPYSARLIVGGGEPTHFPSSKTYDDEFVETVGWFVTEGCVSTYPSGSHFITLAQSEKVNGPFVKRIRRLRTYWETRGETFREDRARPDGVVTWHIGVSLTGALLDATHGKSIPASFLMTLTREQAELLLQTLIDADGTRKGEGSEVWYQDDAGRVDGFQMLAAMVEGIRTNARTNNRGEGLVGLLRNRKSYVSHTVERAVEVNDGPRKVWCPTVASGVWFARRGGYTYWTGNSSPVTVVYGAKMKQLERGPRQIWAGMPVDGRIETLKLEGDLTAARSYIDFVKKVMHELSDTPEGALGAMQPISNTSGVALHMQYQPLIGKTRRKKAQYEPGFEQINYFMLRIGSVRGLISLPFDLCKVCSGRIVEVEDGTTTNVWDPTTQSFAPQPVRKKRCYHIDKQTLEFTDPYEMRLKWWRQYGFGSELREMPLSKIVLEILQRKRSFWDYTVYQEQEMEKWRTENEAVLQAAHGQAVDNMTPPEQAPVPEGVQAPEPNPHIPPTSPATIPVANVAPPKIEPPPALRIMPLPDGEINVPDEPEEVQIVRTLVNPDTGEVVQTFLETKFLVPTGCKRSAYLNPFESKVECVDVLPKDEALQAQLYGMYQTNGWVDEEWCQDHIPEIAVDATDIRRRKKALQVDVRKMQPAQVAQTQAGQTPQMTTYMGELAPQVESLGQVPGPGGNPVDATQQLGMPPVPGQR